MVVFGCELIVAIFLTGVLDFISAEPTLLKICERDGRWFSERTHFRKKTLMGCENCYCPRGGGTPNCAQVTCGIPFCAYGVEYKSGGCCPTCRKPGGNRPPLPPRLIAPRFDLDDLGPRPPGYNPWKRPRYYGPPSPPADPPRDSVIPPLSPFRADDSNNEIGPPAFDPLAMSGPANQPGHPVYSRAARSVSSRSAIEPAPPGLMPHYVRRSTERDYIGVLGPPGSDSIGNSLHSSQLKRRVKDETSPSELAGRSERIRKAKKRPYLNRLLG